MSAAFTSLADKIGEQGISPKHYRPGEQRIACPECKRGPKDDALGLRIEHDDRAFWSCFRCGWAGAVGPGKGSATDANPPRPRPPAAPASPVTDWRPVWARAVPIEPGTVASRYLTGRGCALPHRDGDLRYDPSACHPDGHVGPALAALVTHAVTAEPMTLHRTWLAKDGTGKAAIDRPRLLWTGAPKTGGVIRLWPDAEVTSGLALAEGIETALSLAAAFGLAWATVDAGNLAAFPVLDGIEALTIAADHDRPNPRTGQRAGITAAETCAKRWHEAGREVRIWLSATEGLDFNDRAREALA